MTPLRQKMIDQMLLHGFAERTKSTYLSAVIRLAKHYHQSPDTLTPNQLRDYFLSLIKDRGLSPASCRLCFNALKFFYVEVLKLTWFNEMKLILPKKEQHIPELLSHEEVVRILSACRNEKHHALLSTCYACGLRVNELVKLQRHHLDSERHVIRIEQGKGNKDRLVSFPDRLIRLLQHYCQTYRAQRGNGHDGGAAQLGAESEPTCSSPLPPARWRAQSRSLPVASHQKHLSVSDQSLIPSVSCEDGQWFAPRVAGGTIITHHPRRCRCPAR
jgi:site-specific recombinase XerD